jgi:Subtilase family/PEP-CTERM motif
MRRPGVTLSVRFRAGRQPRRALRGAGLLTALLVAALLVTVVARAAEAIDLAVPWEGGDVSRQLLGDGTGVVIGLVDSGVDGSHPFLSGSDSLGQPREVARANFVTSEASNTGDDVAGHGTSVASIALGQGEIDGVRYDGLATDARYVNARVLDSSNSFQSTQWVVNGVGFAVQNHADVINLSLLLNSTQSDGDTQLDLMVDYLVDTLNIFTTLAAGNFGNAQPPHGPAAARNGLTVGALVSGNLNFSRVASFSDAGPTSDGRSKPDVVAPGSLLHAANSAWDDGPGNSLIITRSGTSFAAPQAAGLAVQMIDYGRAHGLSTDAKVLRVAITNSAVKTLDNNEDPWSHGDTLPLDSQQGAGRIDAAAAAMQYMAGCFDSGSVPLVGWALRDIFGESSAATTSEVFSLDSQPLLGSYFDATLNWNRHVTYSDFGALGVIDGADFFSVDPLNPQDNLDLFLLRDGIVVASSVSAVDTVEHVHFLVDQPGHYDLRITRYGGPDPGESYALAWHGVAVPEPSSLALLALGAAAMLIRRGRMPRLA